MAEGEAFNFFKATTEQEYCGEHSEKSSLKQCLFVFLNH